MGGNAAADGEIEEIGPSLYRLRSRRSNVCYQDLGLSGGLEMGLRARGLVSGPGDPGVASFGAANRANLDSQHSQPRTGGHGLVFEKPSGLNNVHSTPACANGSSLGNEPNVMPSACYGIPSPSRAALSIWIKAVLV